MGNSGVSSHHAVELKLKDQRSYGVDVLISQIGGDLNEQRHVTAGCLISRLAHSGEDGTQAIYALQVTQPRGVGAGDVNHQVVGPTRHSPRRVNIVSYRIFQRRHLSFTNIGAHNNGAATLSGAQFTQRSCGFIGAGVVKAHLVTHCAHIRVAPQSRRLIARLGLSGKRTYLNKTKAQHVHAGNGFAFLIHTRS